MAAPVAVLATAALLAGCGTASSSSGGGTTGTATTSTNGFDPNLVPAGGSSPGTRPKSPKQKSAQKSGSKSGRARSGGGSSGGTTGSGGGAAASNSAAPAAPPVQTRTVTVSHTKTVTRTVTKVVRPKVPVGAGLPSRAAALSVSHFDAARGNIGCRISNGGVRCDIGNKVWHPPAKPRSCHAAWAPGLMVDSSGGAFFVCSRSSVLDPTGTYIRSGYDDKVGSVTCQVRSFGVTCFASDGHGFFIGRTGYTKF